MNWDQPRKPFSLFEAEFQLRRAPPQSGGIPSKAPQELMPNGMS